MEGPRHTGAVKRACGYSTVRAHSGILGALRPVWSPDVIKADKGKK